MAKCYKITCLLAIGSIMLLSGCAPAYHSYAGGCTPYGYCPLAPLPYSAYCGCPTPVAECYLAGGTIHDGPEMPDPDGKRDDDSSPIEPVSGDR